MSIEEKKKTLLNNIEGGLPKDYQQVDYICRQSGTVYINTGYIFTTTTDIRLVYFMPSASGNIASCGNNSANRYGYYQNSATQVLIQKGGTNYALDISNNEKHDVTFGMNGVVCDGVNLLSENVAINRSYKMLLCAYNGGWSSNVRIYNFQAYENGVLIKDLIPCYRKSDNEIGMYDMIGKEFIAKSGSGTMTYGSEV